MGNNNNILDCKFLFLFFILLLYLFNRFLFSKNKQKINFFPPKQKDAKQMTKKKNLSLHCWIWKKISISIVVCIYVCVWVCIESKRERKEVQVVHFAFIVYFQFMRRFISIVHWIFIRHYAKPFRSRSPMSFNKQTEKWKSKYCFDVHLDGFDSHIFAICLFLNK